LSDIYLTAIIINIVRHVAAGCPQII